MKNLVFHRLLRWKTIILPILTTWLRHFFLNVWRMYFWTWERKVSRFGPTSHTDLLAEFLRSLQSGLQIAPIEVALWGVLQQLRLTQKNAWRPVYTCDFWCDFANKTLLTLPCTNAFFREVSRGLGRKLSHIIWRHPSFKFLLAWRYFVAALRD